LKILVVGSGGREHTLCWKLSQSPKVEKIYCAPGNGGIGEIAECVDIKVGQEDYFLRLAKFCLKEKIDLTFVGPEVPLCEGMVDYFQSQGLACFGPKKEAARLERSKIFAKEFMRRHNIPTADFEVARSFKEAKDCLRNKNFPIVVKADGLAAGKGVVICQDRNEAIVALENMMVGEVFGQAGSAVVIEECLEGEEVSVLAFCDGRDFIPMVSSQDHKRACDQDKGPNTGGMGAYSPARVITGQLQKRIEEEILMPTISGMQKEGREYRGIIYLGLMINRDGPKLLEYNVRFGDPETQVVLPRLKSDLIEVALACIEGNLSKISLEWESRTSACVVLASGGYPGEYRKGLEISGLKEAAKLKDILIFHAGTKREGEKIITSGGRVLGVTASGETIKEAIDNSYQAVAKINFDKMHYRKDIGWRAIKA